MKFPKKNRILYNTNILFEVIFQARFPQILKIASEEPAKFQDVIRKKGFPETQIKHPDFPTYVPESFQKAFAGEVQYFFLSEEGDYKTTLTKDFIALSCTKYTEYTDFEERLKTVLEIFENMYEPGAYTRLGLRYRNLANKTVLGEICKNVRDFIPASIAPELTNDLAVAEEVTGFEKTISFADEEGNANVRYLLGKFSGTFGTYKINNEESYIIDIDCFTEKKVHYANNVIQRTKQYNEHYVRNIFHAAATDHLLAAMGPSS